jgi:hypothetical protein
MKVVSNFLCELILPISTECGGYVNGEGLVSSPNYLSDADDIDECYWFVETRKNDAVVYLKRNDMKNVVSNGQLPIITVCHYIVLFKIRVSEYFINCICSFILKRSTMVGTHRAKCSTTMNSPLLI